MSFKTLHQFTLSLTQETDEVQTETKDGKTITTTTKVTKAVPHVIVLKEPTRREKQELSLFQSIAHNEAVNMGLLPRLLMIQKLSKEPGNPISGDEDKTLSAMNSKLQELANDYIRLNAQSTPETDDAKERKEKLLLEYMVLSKKVTDINTAYQSVFAHTAEQYAQNKVLTWLTLFLTYVKIGDKYEPMFGGSDFKAKEERLGELEDAEDKLYLGSVEKLSTYFMLYFFGRASTPEGVATIEKEWEKQLEADRKMKEEAAKKEAEKGTPAPEATPAAPVEEAK